MIWHKLLNSAVVTSATDLGIDYLFTRQEVGHDGHAQTRLLSARISCGAVALQASVMNLSGINLFPLEQPKRFRSTESDSPLLGGGFLFGKHGAFGLRGLFHVLHQLNAFAAVSPFIVVPGHQLHEPFVELHPCPGIEH